MAAWLHLGSKLRRASDDDDSIESRQMKEFTNKIWEVWKILNDTDSKHRFRSGFLS